MEAPTTHDIGITDLETTSRTIVAAQQNYKIIRAVGSGAMGTVFLVEPPDRGEPMALKFLPAGLMTETRINAFKREFSLLSELHHPHVCRVYDFGFSSSHKQYFFTAQFVEGVDLFRAMVQAPIEEVELVISQILSSLDFIHTVGLVHFDIKGDNILVSRKGGKPHATLVDFGITSPVDQPLVEIAGTLYYMAPELLQPKPQIDHRVDLYSFGVACYRLLSGIYPYEVSTIEEARAWHKTKKIDFEPLRSRGLPEYLINMVEKLLAFNPEDRFSSASVVLKYLSLHSGTEYKTLPSIERAKLLEGPMVGREGFFATAKNAIKRVVAYANVEQTMDQEEHPQAYFISGPRGFGKSRLLKEIKMTAQIEDCATWLIDGEREGRDLNSLLDAFGLLSTDEQIATPDEASQLLLEAARDRSTCYLFDNIDAAGPGVQKTIHELLAKLYSATLTHTAPPLIVIAGFSSGSENMPTTTGTPTLELQPLTKEEVASYVKQQVGSDAEAEKFVNAVWDFSQGVPFLMTEATRRYHDQSGELPSSIEELYAQQMSRLPEEARRIVECLAFSNSPLSRDTLESLCNVTDDTLLHMLQSEGLIRITGIEEDITTATGALAQAIVKNLTPKRRQELADGIVQWMKQSADFNPINAAEYAIYMTDTSAALKLLQDAASQAEQEGESGQAVIMLNQSIGLISADPQMRDEVAKIERRVATLLLYQGKYQACEEILHRISAQQGEPSVEDLKMLGLVKRAQRQPKEAGQFYDRALNQLAEDPSNPTFLFILNERAQAYLEEGAVQKSIELYQKSLRWTRQLSKEKKLRVTNNNLGIALSRVGKFDEALDFYQEKLKTFAHEKRIAASVHGQIGVIYLNSGNIDGALTAFKEAWIRSVEMGDQHNAPALLDNIINLLQKKAAYSEALHYAQQSFKLKAVNATDLDLARSLMTVAKLYLHLSLPDLCARYLTQAMRLARKGRNYQLIGEIHVSFGYLYKDLGRLMESLNAFEEAIAIGENNEDEDLIIWGCYGAVDLLVESGEVEEAMPYLQRLSLLMDKDQSEQEFSVRFQILLNKLQIMKQPQPEGNIEKSLENLCKLCVESGWLELRWEVEHLLGVYHHKRDEIEKAYCHLETANGIIVQIAEGLSEEYRGGFERQRSRAKVIADFRAVSHMHDDISTDPSQNENQTTAAPNLGIDTAPRTIATGNSFSPGTIATSPPSRSFIFKQNKKLSDYEKEIIETTVEHFSNDLVLAAKSLGITVAELQNKLNHFSN